MFVVVLCVRVCVNKVQVTLYDKSTNSRHKFCKSTIQQYSKWKGQRTFESKSLSLFPSRWMQCVNAWRQQQTAKLCFSLCVKTDEFTLTVRNGFERKLFPNSSATHESRLRKKTPSIQTNQHVLKFNTLLTASWMHFG